MSVDLGRKFPPAISSSAPLQERYDHLHEQVDILASWILNNCPDEIGRGNPREGEGACEVALRLMREWKLMKVPPSEVLWEVNQERAHLDAKWSGPEYDAWPETEDFGRFIFDRLSRLPRRQNLIEIAALAVAAVESLDRRAAAPTAEKGE